MFADLDLLPTLQNTLSEQGLHTLTEVQRRALPVLLGDGSVIAVAETGSGKTLVYVLPILHHLKRLELDDNPVVAESEPRALVLTPTRELGDQVARVFKAFTHDTRLRVRRVLGGRKGKQNRENVEGTFEVLVATPGRLTKLLEGDELSLDAVRFLVLDEADQLLDPGFFATVLDVVQRCPSRMQVALLSATLPDLLCEVAQHTFPDAQLVQTRGASAVVPTLTTEHVDVPDGKRFPVLARILGPPTPGTLLFANTAEQCDRVVDFLREQGWDAAVLRGNMDPVTRRHNLRAFRSGELAALVTTDMGGRGLDIDRVTRVINVHLPRERDNYLHRVGRTARAGRAGTVINLVTPRDAVLLDQLDDDHAAPAVRHPPRR